MTTRPYYAHGGRGASKIVGQSGNTKHRRVSPPATEEIKARARELWAEKPGEGRRVVVRLFREFGVSYSETAVRKWCKEPITEHETQLSELRKETR